MIILMFLAAVASQTPAQSASCSSLRSQLDDLERAMASSHDFNESQYASKAQFLEAMRPSRRNLQLATAQLAGLGDRTARIQLAQLEAEDRQELKELEDIRAEQAQKDRDYLARADSVTTLLLANRCTPPTRLISWFTYSKKNPINAHATIALPPKLGSPGY